MQCSKYIGWLNISSAHESRVCVQAVLVNFDSLNKKNGGIATVFVCESAFN